MSTNNKRRYLYVSGLALLAIVVGGCGGGATGIPEGSTSGAMVGRTSPPVRLPGNPSTQSNGFTQQSAHGRPVDNGRLRALVGVIFATQRGAKRESASVPNWPQT